MPCCRRGKMSTRRPQPRHLVYNEDDDDDYDDDGDDEEDNDDDDNGKKRKKDQGGRCPLLLGVLFSPNCPFGKRDKPLI